MADICELLFFDTFSHESSEELNLDLVQFPKPVVVSEVRIIPLGARVQADFPGGVRLGATNPSQFNIEFFVNDLGKPGASTFESLGGFEYSQNGRIHLECHTGTGEPPRQIPTDGLVLRGWYTTITLAVYGSLTKTIAEPVIPPPISTTQVVPPVVVQHPQHISSESQQNLTPIQNPEWQQDIAPIVPLDPYASVNTNSDMYNSAYPENYENQVYQHNYYNTEGPKDPRNFQQHIPETESPWDREKPLTDLDRGSSQSQHREDRDPRDRERDRERSRRRSQSTDRGRDPPRHRDRSHGYSRSPSRDRDYKKRDYHSRSPSCEYRSGYQKRDLRSRGPSYERNRSYERTRESSYDRHNSEDIRKRPRTPPLDRSPRRPHTPEHGPDNQHLSPVDSVLSEDDRHEYDRHYKHAKPIQKSDISEKLPLEMDDKSRIKLLSPSTNTGTPLESPAALNDEELSADGEQFEPILSDEDIGDETDSQFADLDYDFLEYSNSEEVLKLFNPFSNILVKYKKTVEDAEHILSPLIEILTKNSKIYTPAEFKELANDVKEEWIHTLEQLPPVLSSINKSNWDLIVGNQMAETLFNWIDLGLNFNLALSHAQPGYKIRHIKSGIRLTEGLCLHNEVVTILLERNFNIFIKLLDLYFKDYMALSIKLMIFRALDSVLSNSKSLEIFIECEDFVISKKVENENEVKYNGYQALLLILQQNPLTRVKFAIKSLINKLHIYEVLKKLKQTVLLWCPSDLTKESCDIEIMENEIELVAQCLDEITKVIEDPLSIAQPKRFLPVSSQFETFNDMCNQTALHEFFTANGLLECITVILNHAIASKYSALITPTLDLLQAIIRTHSGLIYFSNRIEIVNLIVRSILQTPSLEDFIDISRSYNLGLEISYKLQTLYHIEYLDDISKNNEEFIEQLHALFCLTISNPGKIYVAEVLSMSHYPSILLNMFDFEKQPDIKEDPSIKLKSPALGYAIDLIFLMVRNSESVAYLQTYGRKLFELTRQHEFYETAISTTLHELAIYLRPIETGNAFNYDDITALCDCLKRCYDIVPTFPGDLITCLRILRHLTISDRDGFDTTVDHVELKYKYVTLRLFSADGVAVLIGILEKLCQHFAQPGLHTSTLVSNHGLLLTQIILPAVQLLRKMLTYVINCRNTMFKDLTAINVLLQTYSLMNSVPPISIAYNDARIISLEIIKTLLAYTQPVSTDVSETESVHKSLWTLLIGEIIKYIVMEPSCFIPGLLAFSEMLPIPLPIISRQPLTEDETHKIVTARRLWSAHLHCQGPAISEMIQILCQTTYPPLLQVLRKVCLQLADLAPNMALVVAKTLVDLLLSVPSQGQCDAQATKILYFFTCLVPQGSVKAAALSIVNGGLCTFLCTILRTPGDSNAHLQTQDCVLNFIQSLCDTETKLVPYAGNIDNFLCNVLPGKETFSALVSAVIDHAGLPNSVNCLTMAMRTLILFTEHDYGFYYLKMYLEKRPLVLPTVFEKIASCFKESAECITALGALLELLRFLVASEEIGGPLPQRSKSLNPTELALIVGWTDKPENTIRTIEQLLEECSDDKDCGIALGNLRDLINLLCKSTVPSDSSADTAIEPTILPAEPLLTQFASRVVWRPDACEERVPISFWLTPPSYDDELEMDQVAFDLTELVRVLLPLDTNIPADCKRLLHLSQSPLASRDRPTSTPMFRTRKMDVEPSTGRPDKRPFITPMRGRGFPRSQPLRGSDLFRSRPPNTSRPPSLHVDDFVALETCGAQPTGPTGYNKLSREIISSRGTRGGRGRMLTGMPSVQQGYRPVGRGAVWPTAHLSEQPGSLHFRSSSMDGPSGHFMEHPSHFNGGHFVSAGPRGRLTHRGSPGPRGHSRTFTR